MRQPMLLLLLAAARADDYLLEVDYGSQGMVVAAPVSAQCAANEYYSTVTMSCLACARLAADEATAAVLTGEDADALGNARACGCPPNFVEAKDITGCGQTGACESGSYACAACAEAALLDQSACMSCGNTTTGFDAATGDCGCPANHVLAERDAGGTPLAAKECFECGDGSFAAWSDTTQAGAVYAADPYACHRCPDARMRWTSAAGCACPDGLCGESPTGVCEVGLRAYGPTSCVDADKLDLIEDDYPEDEAASVILDKIQRGGPKEDADAVFFIDPAATFRQMYANASTKCAYHDGSGAADAACQQLANLCVMTGYRMWHPACALSGAASVLDGRYTELKEQRDDVHDLGAKAKLPWLTYDVSGENVRADAGIEQGFAFAANVRNKKHLLELRAATYAANGTFLGTRELAQDLFYCGTKSPRTFFGGGRNRPTAWLRYGWSAWLHFRCDLRTLYDKEQLFYDPYLVDPKANCGGERCVYPIPIKTQTFRDEDNAKVNQNGKSSKNTDDRFVRRFSLFDKLVALQEDDYLDPSAFTYFYEDGKPLPEYVRYLDQITLKIEARSTKPGRMHTPHLELRYRERRTFDVMKKKEMREARVDFTVEYFMEDAEFWRIQDAFFFVLVAISGLLWFYALRVWQANTYGSMDTVGVPVDEYTCVYYGKWLVLYARLCVHIFFPLVFALSSYWLVFFKLQDTVYVLLPEENRWDGRGFNYYPVRTIVISLWCFQAAVVGKLVYEQCSVDIFFVDWEKSRSTSVKHRAPVSIWRTLFVANEWNELQTARKTDITLTLLVMAWVLVGEKYENVASPIPDLEELGGGHHNIALRFANTTWWFLIIAGAQWLWNYFVWERYFSEPQAQQFLDLMTVAKVSIFVMDSEFHGWYLHGDAPFSHADDTMNALARHLLNEQMSYSIGRGLEVEQPDLQTFQIWLTPAFRAAWHAVTAGAELEKAVAQPARSPTPGGGPQRGFQPPKLIESLFGRGRAQGAEEKRAVRKQRTEKTATMEQVGAFLKTFLTHGYRDAFDLDWELRFPSIWERLSYAPPPYAVRTAGAKGRVIFQPDVSWFGGDDGAPAARAFAIPSRGGFMIPREAASSRHSIYGEDVSSPGWTGVVLLGHDYELLLLEVLTFAVADIWFRNTWVSILCTYLLHHGVRLLRAIAGETNLSDRTLVDARFLI